MYFLDETYLPSSEQPSNPNKALVCHVPPGNPDGAHTIEIGQGAIDAHLGHGDTLGPCPILVARLVEVVVALARRVRHWGWTLQSTREHAHGHAARARSTPGLPRPSPLDPEPRPRTRPSTLDPVGGRTAVAAPVASLGQRATLRLFRPKRDGLSRFAPNK